MKKIVVLFVALISVGVWAAAFYNNDKVQVDWGGEWYPATILDVKNEKYLIRYDGYGSDSDEWVVENRIRRSVIRTPRTAAKGGRNAGRSYLAGVETIWSAAYHPSGRYLAAGSDFGTVMMVDTESFAVIKTVEIGQSRVKTIAFTRSGDLFAAGCNDGTLQIRDSASQSLKNCP